MSSQLPSMSAHWSICSTTMEPFPNHFYLLWVFRFIISYLFTKPIAVSTVFWRHLFFSRQGPSRWREKLLNLSKIKPEPNAIFATVNSAYRLPVRGTSSYILGFGLTSVDIVLRVFTARIISNSTRRPISRAHGSPIFTRKTKRLSLSDLLISSSAFPALAIQQKFDANLNVVDEWILF